MFLDGVCFDMRIGKSIETVPVLAAIGVKKTRQKLVLSLQAGDKESASNWREFFNTDFRAAFNRHSNIRILT